MMELFLLFSTGDMAMNGKNNSKENVVSTIHDGLSFWAYLEKEAKIRRKRRRN
jgi:hypothetical protein